MLNEENLSGISTDKELIEKELLKLTTRYNDRKKDLKENFHSIIDELGKTDFKEDVETEKADIKKFVAQKKNKQAITVQKDKFDTLEEELYHLNIEMKSLQKILNVLNHLDEFKRLNIVYNYFFNQFDELEVYFTATINDQKAQVVYRSIFTQDVLELRTDFDGENEGYNDDIYILPSGNMYSFKEFKHLEKERFEKFRAYLVEAEEDNFLQAFNFGNEIKLVDAEMKVLETITEEEYKEIYTDLYLDFLLFTEHYIK